MKTLMSVWLSPDTFTDEGEWIDLDKVEKALKALPIYRELRSTIEKLRDEMSESLNLVNPKGAHRTLGNAAVFLQGLQQETAGVMERMKDVAEGLIAQCDGPLGWIEDFPEITDENREELLEKLDEAEVVMDECRAQVQRAQEEFANTKTELDEYINLLHKAVNELKQDKTTAENARDTNITNGLAKLTVPWYMWAFATVAAGIMEGVYVGKREALRNDQNEKYKEDCEQIETWIEQLEDEIESGTEYEGASKTWVELANEIAVSLGGILGSFSDMKLAIERLQGNMHDRYRRYLQKAWKELRENAVGLLELIAIWEDAQ